jgi:hypothetical protein
VSVAVWVLAAQEKVPVVWALSVQVQAVWVSVPVAVWVWAAQEKVQVVWVLSVQVQAQEKAPVVWV